MTYLNVYSLQSQLFLSLRYHKVSGNSWLLPSHGESQYAKRLLTFDVEYDPLADGGRDSVLGDAKVGPHLGPGDPEEVEDFAHHAPPLLLAGVLLPLDDDLFVVLSSPGDLGLGRPLCLL